MELLVPNSVTVPETTTLLLQVNGQDYRVAFPLSAVIVAEEKLGRQLHTPGAWFGLPTKDIPVLLHAGLLKNHPGITGAQVTELCENLNPEACLSVLEALGALAFPRFTARVQENLKQTQTTGVE